MKVITKDGECSREFLSLLNHCVIVLSSHPYGGGLPSSHPQWCLLMLDGWRQLGCLEMCGLVVDARRSC